MSDEKPTPEDFLRSVPKEVTEHAVFEDEDGVYYGYGHIDPIEMVLAIKAVADYNETAEDGMQINSEDMQYYYAKIIGIDNTAPDWDDEVTFTLCKPTDEGAFPVTIWNYR